MRQQKQGHGTYRGKVGELGQGNTVQDKVEMGAGPQEISGGRQKREDWTVGSEQYRQRHME